MEQKGDITLPCVDEIDSERLQVLIDSSLAQYRHSVKWQLTHRENIHQVLPPFLRLLFSDVSLELQKNLSTGDAAADLTMDDEVAIDRAVDKTVDLYEKVVTHRLSHENNIENGLKPLVTQVVVEFAHQQRERTLRRQEESPSGEVSSVLGVLDGTKAHQEELEIMHRACIDEFLCEYGSACTWRLTHRQLVFSLLEPRLKQFFGGYLSMVLPASVLAHGRFNVYNAFGSYEPKQRGERLVSWISLNKNLPVPGSGSKPSALPGDVEGRVEYNQLLQIAAQDVSQRYFDSILLRLSHKENIQLVLRPLLEAAIEKLDALGQDVILLTDMNADVKGGTVDEVPGDDGKRTSSKTEGPEKDADKVVKGTVATTTEAGSHTTDYCRSQVSGNSKDDPSWVHM